METLMNATPIQPHHGPWLTSLVALLCSAVTACHSGAVVNARASTTALADRSEVNSLIGVAPAAPFDEVAITPMETVGAPATD
jgi:hypothetical protein